MEKSEVIIEILTLPPEKAMARLERMGYWTAPSDIYSTGYCAVNGRLVILKGDYGAAGIRYKDLRALAKELLEYADILEFRKDAHIVGA